MISVIIATKDRDEALRKISLPSLFGQDTSDFEVILWDASDTEKSRIVASDFSHRFEAKGVDLRYFRARRVGIASQRNDAVRVARGEIVFFIDDDSEVSPEGMLALEKCFRDFPECVGAGLVVVEISDEKRTGSRFMEKLKGRLYKALGYRKTRKVHPSGSHKGMTAPPGPAQWLSGCSMAFRREIFDSMQFNEKLETFGGYAMAEDVEFSHRVFLSSDSPLLIPSEGDIRHHGVLESRGMVDERTIAMFFYNKYLVMQVASVRAPIWGKVAFAWNIAKRFVSMAFRNGFDVTKKGSALAFQQIIDDNKQDRRKGQ